MRISFNFNGRFVAGLLFTFGVVFYTWISVLGPARDHDYLAGAVTGLAAVSLLAFYVGLTVAGWFLDRVLIYHFRCQGYNEEAVRGSVKEIKESSRRMPAPNLWK